MKTTRTWWTVFSLLLGLLLVATNILSGWSQEQRVKYPTKAINLVVPFSPGGGVDMAGRLIAAYASQKWGQPVNVVNAPGGSGAVGTQKVLSASPDGYTMLMDSHATSSVLAAGMPNLPFDWQNRTWIGRLTTEPTVFVVKADAKWKSLQEVVVAVKQDPGSFKWGAGGAGTISRFSTTHLLSDAGIDPKATNMVVFEGNAPALTAVAGGHVDFAGLLAGEIKSMVAAGKIRPLAVLAAKRLSGLPDVPTNSEVGFPNLAESSWQGVSGPPGLPQYVIDAWAAIIKQAGTDPDFHRDAEKVGKFVSVLGPSEFKPAVLKEYEVYKSLADKIGLSK
jgi:tripartite-type tricarboxylate transporter receptor subunit TctC